MRLMNSPNRKAGPEGALSILASCKLQSRELQDEKAEDAYSSAFGFHLPRLSLS